MNRRIRVRYVMRAGVPVLLAATLLDACGESAESPGDLGTSAGSGAGGSAVAGAGGVSSGAGGVLIVGGAGDGGGGSGGDPHGPDMPDTDPPPDDYEFSAPVDHFNDACEFYVDVPEAGTPALVEPICAEDIPPVASGWAARALLENNRWLSGSSEIVANGRVQIAGELAARVEGLPEVTVMDVSDEVFRPSEIKNMRFEDGEYRFDAVWDHSFDWHTELGSSTRLVLRIAFDMRCPDGGSGALRRVEAQTVLHFCYSNQWDTEPQWTSSGDVCNVCAVIAEMAPSPIVPGQRADDMPLARAIRLALKTVAKIGRTLVLWAEHDGGSGDWDYDWSVSGGDFQRVGDDLVAWTPPEGADPHLLQVALVGRQAAAVATLRWDACAQGAA